nr:proteasome-activating nucleotidase [Methanopyrus kandleri]
MTEKLDSVLPKTSQGSNLNDLKNLRDALDKFSEIEPDLDVESLKATLDDLITLMEETGVKDVRDLCEKFLDFKREKERLEELLKEYFKRLEELERKLRAHEEKLRIEARRRKTLEKELEMERDEKAELREELRRKEVMIEKLRSDLQRMKKPPLIVGTVEEILDDGRVIVKSSTGPKFVSNVSPTVDRNELEPGANVALNQQSMAVVDVLPSEKDSRVLAMEVDESPDVSYDDIGGLDEQIREIREVVEKPLKEPELFEKVGVEPPKGVLLYGPPGTGKTLLAKAVANHADATFIRLAAPELVQKFIGEGARLVRELFELAREKAPSIIFIDEIDAIGARRMRDATSGDREVQRTLTQLLAEMDGFDPLDDIKVIAATNRKDILDPALLRPGRFDRHIKIPLPDEEGRYEIFKIHTRDMNLAEDVDLQKLAKITEGASGADIKAICTEAGMMAIREDRDIVTMDDFLKAVDRVMGKKEEESGEFKRAYH